MFISDFFPTFISLAGGSHEQERPIDGIDMTEMLFEGSQSKRTEIIYDVTGSARLPTIRSGDFKLMGDVLYNVVKDPGEQNDVAAEHLDIVKRLAARLEEAGNERPPLGDKPLVMDPPLPYIYGLEEQKNTPNWLVKAVEEVRKTQPTEWAPGETPWPKAPQGANASKMDGLKDEAAK
jgi:arylsulfatase A-like enzyme